MSRYHRVNRKVVGSKQAFIFGPFIGELYWEAFRFAPYAISLKKRFPQHFLVVFTRPRSFDLYGQYADILVPLKIKEGMYVAEKFKLKAYPISEYRALESYIKRVYLNMFEITDHFVPRIDGFMWKVKWQYPRKYMDYSFLPRKRNSFLVEKFYGGDDNIVLTTESNVVLADYNVIQAKDFLKNINNYLDKNCSSLGCLIEMIKKCKFVISNFENDLARLSVLLKKDVITVNEKFSDDAIYLMNPHKVSVIKCDKYEEGVREYENNF
jgi:hypothetical protein